MTYFYKFSKQLFKLCYTENLVIASKILPKNWSWPARPGTDIQEVFPKEHIIKQVNDSLKALNIETCSVPDKLTSSLGRIRLQ